MDWVGLVWVVTFLAESEFSVFSFVVTELSAVRNPLSSSVVEGSSECTVVNNLTMSSLLSVRLLLVVADGMSLLELVLVSQLPLTGTFSVLDLF